MGPNLEIKVSFAWRLSMTVGVEMVEVHWEGRTQSTAMHSLGKRHCLRDELGRKSVGRPGKKQKVVKG